MFSESHYRQSRILVVDDEADNVGFVEELLSYAGYKKIRSTTRSVEVLALCKEFSPDLILLDLHMPDPDGYELLRTLRDDTCNSYCLPILVFTADATDEARKRALELGASDFLTKPGDAAEILLRVKNFIQMRHMHRLLEDHNRELEERVAARTKELMVAQQEVLERLAMAAEYRDDDTGEHAQRVGELAYQIACHLGLSEEECARIRLAAPLHDLGKIGIEDSILQKAGPLTPEEFGRMKEHAEIGRRIFAGSSSPFLQVAEIIALSHHERWDGTGYPRGLVGAEIPLEGRIVAVADVFDALVNVRPYKRAWTFSEAISEIKAQSGKHFDPSVVRAFIEAIQSLMPDYELAA